MTNTRDGAASPVDLVTMLVATWASLDSMLATLDERSWKSPTQCPGWSVQDTVSHLIATERMLAGDPPTTHRAVDLAHTRNPIGEWNEHEVDARRTLPGSDVLSEWRDVVRRREASLRALSEDDFTRPMGTPTGPGTLASFLELRVMDSWVHEVDIRRALSLELTTDEASAAHSLRRFARSMQIVVGKRVAPADGTVVRFELTDRPSLSFTIGVRGKRAEILGDDVVDTSAAASPNASPTTTLAMHSDLFTQLACGRRAWSSQSVGDARDVVISGDRTLGESVLAAMNVMI
jgi:uncharacterized protein (TIGR03083 family)